MIALSSRFPAAGEQLGDLFGEASPEVDVLVGPALRVAFTAAHPGVLVVEAQLLGLVQGGFLDEQTLAFIALASLAPPDHDRGQAAGLLGSPGQGRITSRHEDEMVHVGTRHAQRARR